MLLLEFLKLCKGLGGHLYGSIDVCFSISIMHRVGIKYFPTMFVQSKRIKNKHLMEEKSQ